MACYIALSIFIATNLIVIAAVLLSQRGMSNLRALNRVGERRHKPRD